MLVSEYTSCSMVESKINLRTPTCEGGEVGLRQATSIWYSQHQVKSVCNVSTALPELIQLPNPSWQFPMLFMHFIVRQ